jgi:hypothetical protein
MIHESSGLVALSGSVLGQLRQSHVLLKVIGGVPNNVGSGNERLLWLLADIRATLTQ